MLSIIQLVAPSWAALPGGESAHWSYAVGESRVDTEGRGRERMMQGEMKNNGERRKADKVENKEERGR